MKKRTLRKLLREMRTLDFGDMTIVVDPLTGSSERTYLVKFRDPVKITNVVWDKERGVEIVTQRDR